MRFLRVALLVVGAIVVVAALWGIALYSNDAAVNADVTKKSCDLTGANTITAVTRIGHVSHTASVDYASCRAVPVGAFVVYHVRSQRTTVFATQGGPCIWDSVTGPC